MIPEKPSGPHPEAETLRRSFRTPSDPDSVDVLGHAAMCAACSVELAAIEAFDARPDVFGGQARRARAAWAKFGGTPEPRRSTFGLMPAFAMAAAVCLAVAFVIFLPHREADVLRGGATLQGAFYPADVIPEPPTEFRFPGGGSGRVRVSVFDAERLYVWTSPSVPAGVAVPFPPEERAKLHPGVAYSWVVLGEGSALPPRTFEIRPAKER